MRAGIIAAIVGLIAATPASASRELPVPPDKGWEHAQTGLILTAKIAGLSRTSLTDLGDAELDMVAQFDDPGRDTEATIYLFRPALASVPVWFDRSVTVLSRRDIYGGVTPVAPPLAFSRPGSTAADSLREVFTPGAPAMHSTGVAVMPVGAWLVVVRISSQTLAPAELDAELSAVIAGIRFPAGGDASQAVAPVAPCTTTLAYRHAKLRKPDMTQALLGSTLALMAQDPKVEKTEVKPAGPWCRDGDAGDKYGVYRHDDGSKSYLLAVGDAGRTVWVSPELQLLAKSNGYSVTFNDLDRSDTFQAFDKLPEPAQVFDLVTTHAPLSRASGNNITISTQ